LVTFTTDSGSIPNKWQHPNKSAIAEVERSSMKIVNIKRAAVAAVSLTALLAVSACSGGGAEPTGESTGGGGGESGYTFAMVTHEAPGDTFWDRIRSGAEQAAKDTGSTLKYSADPEATKQAVLIQNAIDSKVDGIATTLVTPESLIPTVKKAVAAGIPVDSFNSGTDFYKEAGALTHFSSDEKLAGQQAGAKAKADGATKILCTIQQTGSVALEDRCAGVKAAFPNTENIQVNGQDDSAVTSAIQAKLAQDKDINWIITLGAKQALDAIKARDAVGSETKIGTFDLNKEAAEAVQAGNIQFCIDQQPYLQGYLAITQLYLYKKNGNILGGGQPSLTGPSFVDKTNVDAILPFINQNTR
jgi:simple sugar transport system substrate-binding protein